MPEADALPPISYDELIEKLSDPDADLDHYLRYMIEVPVPGRMAPELEPNPALVTDIPPRIEGGVAMGLANWFMKRRRHRTYRRRIRDGWTKPRIVSEGDSWFQYPTSLQDIIDHLMKDHLILSLGAAGDELSDMIRQNEILLNIDAEDAKALVLSAGGNDLFDKGQLQHLVETPFPGQRPRTWSGQRSMPSSPRSRASTWVFCARSMPRFRMSTSWFTATAPPSRVAALGSRNR